MSSGDLSAPHPCTPPSTSDTVAAESELERRTIQEACKHLRLCFAPEDEDDEIKKNLYLALAIVHNALSLAGNSDMEKRIRNVSEFKSYVTSGSNRERELVKLLRSMAKQDSWEDLFKNSTFLSFLLCGAH